MALNREGGGGEGHVIELRHVRFGFEDSRIECLHLESEKKKGINTTYDLVSMIHELSAVIL